VPVKRGETNRSIVFEMQGLWKWLVQRYSVVNEWLKVDIKLSSISKRLNYPT